MLSLVVNECTHGKGGEVDGMVVLPHTLGRRGGVAIVKVASGVINNIFFS